MRRLGGTRCGCLLRVCVCYGYLSGAGIYLLRVCLLRVSDCCGYLLHLALPPGGRLGAKRAQRANGARVRLVTLSRAREKREEVPFAGSC